MTENNHMHITYQTNNYATKEEQQIMQQKKNNKLCNKRRPNKYATKEISLQDDNKVGMKDTIEGDS